MNLISDLACSKHGTEPVEPLNVASGAKYGGRVPIPQSFLLEGSPLLIN